MSTIIPVGANFAQGFQSDVARNEIAPGAAFRMRDYIPEMEAPLRKRGGWAFASPSLDTLGGFAGSVESLGFLPFPSDGHLVAVSNGGSIYQIKRYDGLGGALVSDIGDTAIVPTWPIFWHKTGAKAYGIILAGMFQAGRVPKKYYNTGSLVYESQPLGGTPPLARMGFSWGDYLVLGNYYDPASPTTLYNYRWAFSAVGNPDSWTLTGVNASTMDFPEEVIAGIPLRNAILAWGYNDLHIVTGDTPPPGGNLSNNVLYAGQGTLDGRSVVAWRDQAIWANETGVYMSDGATLTDLTFSGGISIYYRQVVAGFTLTSGWSATAGLYRDRYFLTIRNAVGAVVTTLVCDIQRRAWAEFRNFPGGIYAHRPAGPGVGTIGGDEELFFSHVGLPRVGKVSTLWTPSSTYAFDGDGQPVLPSLETPFYTLGTDGSKRFRRMFLGYDIRTIGTAPNFTVGYVTSPEPGLAYTMLDAEFPETTKYRRKQGFVGTQGLGLGLKIDQVGPSADTRIYDISLDASPHDLSRATR